MDTDPGQITKNGIIAKVPGGINRDENDWQALRWNGDERHGWHYGRFYQSTPMFFTAEGHNLWLGDTYRGRSLFLVSSGPSTKALDLDTLHEPGFMTMGLNNSPKIFRPNLWTCVDSPSSFLRSIWLDPQIQKFAPICSTDKNIFDNDSHVVRKNGEILRDKDGHPIYDDPAGKFLRGLKGGDPLRVRDCPNMVYYRRNEHFRAQQYLWEDTINWGNHGDIGGARSVFLVAIRLAYLLGFRKVYLLGVDFNMAPGTGYSFPQARSKGSIQGNNETYEKLVKRFTELKPYFEKENFEIYQCNPESKFQVFPYMSFVDACAKTRLEFWSDGTPIDTVKENTEGLYDREDRMKKVAEAQVEVELAKKAAAQAAILKAAGANAVSKLKGKGVAAAPEKPAKGKKKAKAGTPVERRVYTAEEREEVKARLDAAREMLTTAKKEVADWVEAEPKDGNEAAITNWITELKMMQTNEEQIRTVFRTIEDEKRYKWGEEIRWGLWNPETEEAV